MSVRRSPVLLSLEAQEFYTVHNPSKTTVFENPQQVAFQLLEQPGRFRSPLTLLERLRLRVSALSPWPDTFSFADAFLARSLSPIAPAWQVLLHYLIRRGVIENEPWLKRSNHDSPKLPAVRFFLQGLNRNTISGTGYAFDLETAFSKALGEGLERFFLFPTKLARQRVDVRASTAGMKYHHKRFVHPETLTQFSLEQREQSKRFQFNETSAFAWIRVPELVSGKSVFVPAQCFSLERFTVDKKREPLLREQNTNAAAGGFTLQEALLSAIYEAVERDGFLIYWLNTIAPVRLDVSDCQDAEFLQLLSQLERYRIEACFLDTTTDTGIPSCICVLIDRSSAGPGIAIGGGCNFQIERMLRSSLVEAFSILGNFNRIHLSQSVPKTGYQPFSDGTIGIHERVRIWKQPDMFSRAEFFLSGQKKSLAEAYPERKVFGTASEELDYVTDLFRSLGAGYEIYYAEKEHEVLNTIGYYVVKVLIPELVSLYLSETNAGLGACRLKSVPHKIGRVPSEYWNYWPHPFP